MLFAAMHIQKITHSQLRDIICTNIYIFKNINLIFIFFNKYKLLFYLVIIYYYFQMAKLNDKNRANSNVNKNTATLCNKNQNILYNASSLISNSHDFFYIIVSFQELKTPGLAITHLPCQQLFHGHHADFVFQLSANSSHPDILGHHLHTLSA